MSIASEITRISNNIAAAYTALDGKGATLPAEGSQNSANLADTIDSVPTGGGGGTDFTEMTPCIEALKSLLDSSGKTGMGYSKAGGTAYTLSEQDTTHEHWYNYGFGSGDTSARFAYVFQASNDYTDLYFPVGDGTGSDTSPRVAFWLPSDATVTRLYKSYYKVTFSGTARAGFVITSSQQANGSLLSPVLDLDIFPTENGDNYLSLFSTFTIHYGAIKGLYIFDLGTRTDCDVQPSPGQYFPASIERMVLDETYRRTISSYTNLRNVSQGAINLVLMMNQLDDTSIVQFMVGSSQWDSDKNILKFPNMSVSNQLNLLRNVLMGIDLTKKRRYPVLVDLSGDTETGSLTIGNSSYTTTMSPNAQTLLDIFIKLPSTRSSVSLTNSYIYGNGGSGGFNTLNLSEDAWEYLATNAPTVSSVTLKIQGLYNAYSSNNNLVAPRIKTALDTLVSKGWVLSKS